MSAMQQAMTIIKDEHRSMGAVLKGLQAHLSAVRHGEELPDFLLFQGMFDYIETLPDRVHHPKEDEYLFRLLHLRTHEADAILNELEAQHQVCARLLGAVRQAMQTYQQTHDLTPFERSLNAYAEFLWEHMRREEEEVLPAAMQHLTGEDWDTILIAFSTNRNMSW